MCFVFGWLRWVWKVSSYEFDLRLLCASSSAMWRYVVCVQMYGVSTLADTQTYTATMWRC